MTTAADSTAKGTESKVDELTPIKAQFTEDFNSRMVEGDQNADDSQLEPSFLRGLATHVGSIFLSAVKALLWCIASTIRYIWRYPSHALFSALLLALLGYVLAASSQMHDQLILTEISNGTVDKIIEASRFTRNYSSDKVGQSRANEFLNVGGPNWVQRESLRAVLFHARRAGLSIEHQAVLLATVEVESGFNPMARAPSTTACGLFQFVVRTGNTYGLAQSDCMNPWLNAQAGVAHYIDNYKSRVEPIVRDLEGTEKLFRTFELTYYMHHDGPNFKRPSPKLKATVLGTVAFLFRSYDVLKFEAEQKTHAPTFARKFAERVWKLIAVHVARFFTPEALPN